MAKWISESDNGMPLLRCSACDARVKAEHYRKAVGLKGYDYCPYCGSQMQRPKDIQATIDKLSAESVEQTDCPWK